MKKLISVLILSLAAFTTVVVAQPTVKEIYQTAQTDKQRALGMINEVIRLHPNSARAYFIQSELLLQSGKKVEARASFVKSQQLDPNFTYAKPESVARLRDALGIKPANSTGFSVSTDQLILWGCGILLVILIAVMLLRRKKQDVPDYTKMYNLQQRPITPYNPTSAPLQTPNTSTQNTSTQAAPATGGSGIMGSLAQGAAMGVGVAAGATLANHLLNGNKSSAAPVDSPVPASGYVPDSNFGISDTSSGWDSGSSDSSSDWSGGSSDDSDSW